MAPIFIRPVDAVNSPAFLRADGPARAEAEGAVAATWLASNTAGMAKALL
jgi:hypothetical protein